MTKKILFVCCLIHFAVIICGQTKIPTNSSSKTQLSNWLVAKVSNLDDNHISEIVKNTENYLKSIPSKNIEALYLSNFNDVAIPFYQVFDSINFENSLIATTMIESEKDQFCQLQYAGYDIISKTYLNGSLVASSSYIDNEIHEIKLKKGKNKLIVIGNPNGAYNATI